jgi:hypothetical protein
MSLTIIEDTYRIQKLHLKLEKLIKHNSEKRQLEILITYRPSGWWSKVYYNKDNNIWWANDYKSRNDKFFNWFGKYPDETKKNGILIEINYQKKFKNLKDAAFWAEDIEGNIFLMHSGRMGGGTKGINMENIWKYYSGQKKIINYNEEEYLLVCELDSDDAYLQLSYFINEVERIKNILKFGNVLSDNVSKKQSKKLNPYTPEFWGKRKSYFAKGEVESTSNHGLIVECLKDELEQNYGLKDKIVKNGYVDLGISKKNKAMSIFEIKTSSNIQNIYTGIGQLMIHSHSEKTNPKRFIVLPNNLDPEIEKDLTELNIHTIRFEWKNGKAKFTNLNKFF